MAETFLPDVTGDRPLFNSYSRECRVSGAKSRNAGDAGNTGAACRDETGYSLYTYLAGPGKVPCPRYSTSVRSSGVKYKRASLPALLGSV